jgi:hypothetical protein
MESRHVEGRPLLLRGLLRSLAALAALAALAIA